VRDLARVETVRANQLVGYGLVLGLNGTGDTQQSPFTLQAVVSMLQRYGVTVDVRRVKTKNAAAVMITAEIPAFYKNGAKLDVTVSSLGDATSLQGGTLLQTPLIGADDEVYALAQGPVSIGGFSAGGGGNSVTKNHPTTGRVPGGALIEKEIKSSLAAADGSVRVNLNEPDFDNAARVAAAINERVGEGAAIAEDAATVRVRGNGSDPVKLIADIGEARLQPSTPAKVVLNERTGTVIIGGAVRIAPVAIAHGALTVEIQTEFEVSQPAPFSKKGETVVVPQTATRADEDRAAVVEFQPGVTLAQLVRALNSLRVTPRDIIAIVQSIKEAGALYAELELQ
jgi:flagellar P-ring protein precursor FlgI